MSLTQETFLGASIRNFSATVGWGEQPSTLTVGLVEDPSNGDSFNPNNLEVGHPAYFDYQGWKFGGLIQRIAETRGEQGNPLYEVQLQDPRELLSGVQLILQNYSGFTYGIPNLYNIFGALEYNNFGGSRQNGSGIPWRLVRDTFWQLQVVTPINFRGYEYRLLPIGGAVSFLPEHYRIGGEVISALDYINELTTAVACDYFVDLWEGYIFVYLVDRSVPSITGTINSFIDSVEGAVSKDQGTELVNGVTSKFCAGGKRADLHPQEGGVVPYWGEDYLGNLIIGQGNFESLDGSDYQVVLNGTSMYIATGDSYFTFYKTDLAELRHAMIGKDDWENFLFSKNDIAESIHYHKSLRIGITDRVTFAKFALGAGPVGIVGAGLDMVKKANDLKIQRQIDIVYEFVRKYATEFYGKKFTVPIPHVYAKMEDDTNQITLSQTPVDAGYFDEVEWPGAVANGWLPYNPEKFTTSDNRLCCYVCFYGITDSEDLDDDTIVKTKYGLEHLNPDDYVLDQYPDQSAGEIRENFFMRAEVDERIVFLNNQTLYGPRVIITLPNQVVDNIGSPTRMSTAGVALAEQYFIDHNEADMDKIIADIQRSKNAFGGDYFNFGKFARCYIPGRAVVPLESNILRYGPWYATRKPGKVEVEIDDSLVPWDYGGFSLMNLAGNARVATAMYDHQINETGNITFPGVPDTQLGNALLDSGPAVTDIQVNVAADGVTTTYRMNTWSYQFGKVGKHNMERFKKLSQLAVQQRKMFRKLFGYNRPIEAGGTELIALKDRVSRRDRANSAHTFLGSEVFIDGSGDTLTVKVGTATMAGYNLLSQVNEEYYSDQAIMSLDGMFVPYTTSTGSAGSLPHFESPTSDEEDGPTVDDLNPFGGDSIVTASEDSDTIPGDLINNGNNSAGSSKGVGLRAPVVIAGWGYDLDGNPAPSGAGDDGFYPNYKNRADKWKVGPLDIRWDNERKVWATVSAAESIATNIGTFKLKGNLLPGGYAEAWTMALSGSSNIFVEQSGTSTKLYDYMLVPGVQHFEGDKVVAANMSIAILGSGNIPTGQTTNRWIVINGQCACA